MVGGGDYVVVVVTPAVRRVVVVDDVTSSGSACWDRDRHLGVWSCDVPGTFLVCTTCRRSDR